MVGFSLEWVAPRQFVDEALTWAISDVALDTHRGDLQGPASALVATFLRLEWRFSSTSLWVSPGGHDVDVDLTSPRDVAVAVSGDAHVWVRYHTLPITFFLLAWTALRT